MKEKSAYVLSLLKIFAKSPFEALNHKQVASRMGAFDKGSRKWWQTLYFHLPKKKS